MYTVVIIDDEKIIVEGLTKMFERFIPKCQVIGSRYDGKEGYSIIRAKKPDIVVTDIRMPHVDGHEMIRMLSEETCKSKFMILSGYTEFEYAKRAMELGVKYYITKPVDENELIDNVDKLIGEIDIEREQESTLMRLKDTIQDKMYTLQQLVLRDLVDEGSMIDEYMSYLLGMINFPINDRAYICAIIDMGMVNNKSAEIDEIVKKIKEIIVYSAVSVFYYSENQLGIIISHQEELDSLAVVESMRTISIYIKQQHNIKTSVGIGDIYRSIDGVSKSFEEARHAMNGEILKGSNDVVAYTAIDTLQNCTDLFTQDSIDEIEKCVNNMDYEAGAQFVDNFFQKIIGMPGINISDLQHYCLNVLLFAIRKITPMQIQLNRVLGKNILSLDEISRFRTYEEMKNWLNNVLRSIIDIRAMYNIPKDKDLITQVKEYIMEHLSENISLAIIAEKVFVNPYYLSKLFKEKTGETYINFVMKVRINRAKELLRKTNYKVYEICELVGYVDVNHFSRIFERFEGCKPTHYRKNLKLGTDE